MIRHICAALFILSISFDKFLVLDLGGFTFRISYGAELLFFLVTMASNAYRKDNPPYFLHNPLAKWMYFYIAVAFLSVGISTLRTRSLLYSLWTVFDYIVIYLLALNYIQTRKDFYRFFRIFTIGVLIAATYGLLQILFSSVGIYLPLIAQRMGGIARINGFNYEPSYFAFYLMTCIPIYLFLMLQNVHFFTALRSQLIFAYLFLVCVLSTSLSGWISIAFIFTYSIAFGEIRFSKRLYLKLLLMVIIAGGALVALAHFVFEDALYFVFSKIFEKFDPEQQSSSAPRIAHFLNGARIFITHPILGTGLATRESVLPNLYAETASELGILGLIALGGLIFKTNSMFRKIKKYALSTVDMALVRGYHLVFLNMFLVLFQFNQNLLRQDVFLLLGAMMAMYRLVQKEYAPRISSR